MADTPDPYGPDEPADPDASDVSRNRDRRGERTATDPDVEGTPLRQAVIELRERNPDMTQRQIAESAGCSEPYVSDILREHENRTRSESGSGGVDSEIVEPEPQNRPPGDPQVSFDALSWEQIVLLIVIILSFFYFVYPTMDFSIFVDALTDILNF